MERKKIRKGRALSLSVVVISFFLTFNLAFAQTAEDYFVEGKTYLENQSLSAAHSSFQSALTLSPNHQGANLFFALTRLLMISNSADFNTLLNRAGVSSSGRDVFNWTADFTRDPQGKILLPSNSPTGAELQSFLQNNVLPEIDGALDNLSKVASNYETIYQWTLESGSGSVSSPNTITVTGPTPYWGYNEWVGYKIVVQGTEYTITSNTFDTITVTPNWTIPPGNYNYKIFELVEIDYGDVLIMRGSLYLAKGGIYILSSYNLDIDIDTIVSLYNAGTLNIQNHIVNTYNQLLNLLPAQQLSQAKSLMRDAINTFTSAIDFIKAETDPQDNDLFVIDDPAEEQRYRDLLADLYGALDGSSYVRKIGYQVNLSEFFDRPKTLRNYLPHFIKQFIEADTFPDPTFGGILPSMTSNELNKVLWDCIIYPEALLWTSVPPPAVSSNWSLAGVHFSSSNEGWAVGADSANGRGVLLRYSSRTWTSVSPPAVSANWNLTGVHFTSSNEGWAVGRDLTNGRGVLLHYSNGNWTSVSPPTVSSGWYLAGVHFTSSNEGWAVGQDWMSGSRGVLLHYSNGNWTSVSPPAAGSYWGLAGVHFTSSNEGWAVGMGVLFHYSNGTWTSVSPSDARSLGWLTSVHFTSSNEGWAVGYEDVLFHYYNGSWRSVKVPDLKTTLSSVHFTSPIEGWAVGTDWPNGRGVLLRFSPAISKTACDFDGDQKSDITIWRPGDGFWYIISSKDGSIIYQQWGGGAFNDVPVPGDYDGDGKTDIAVWRPGDGVWYIKSSKDGSIMYQQWGGGAFNDVPVPGDYDGDGKTDIAVWRPGDGVWYIKSSKDGSIIYQQWGAGSLNDEPISQKLNW